MQVYLAALQRGRVTMHLVILLLSMSLMQVFQESWVDTSFNGSFGEMPGQSAGLPVKVRRTSAFRMSNTRI